MRSAHPEQVFDAGIVAGAWRNPQIPTPALLHDRAVRHDRTQQQAGPGLIRPAWPGSEDTAMLEDLVAAHPRRRATIRDVFEDLIKDAHRSLKQPGQ